MDKHTASEQLEEGEIVDDDAFEDISDNSIIEPTFGKFASSTENLRALSLSSDSEVQIKTVRPKRKLLHRKTRLKLQSKRKKCRISSDSSDTDVLPRDNLKDKLKQAVDIGGVESCHKNTLEARLKLMGGLGSVAPPEPPLEENDNIDNSDKIDDSELEKLRMEALKTAVLNKFKRRKRKKALQEGTNEQETPLEMQENKENDTPKDEGAVLSNPVSCNDKAETNVPVDLEEDEDLLRASLLAGLAKKITKVQPPNDSKPVSSKLPVKIAPVLPKRPLNNFKKIVNNKVIQNRIKPQVKPLIINVNGDSDSDGEEIVEQKLPPKAADLNKVIANNVDKFLKEQRAKFESETKKQFQIINKNKNKQILEKSAVKLLPKSQQIEYQQLLKKLKNAERKKRARKLVLLKQMEAAKGQPVKQTVQSGTKINKTVADIVPEISSVQINTKQPVVTISMQNSADKIENLNEIVAAPEIVVPLEDPFQTIKIVADAANQMRSADEDVSDSSKECERFKSSDLEKKTPDITNELTQLQKTLKEIKMHKTGSLQIKSKYQILMPIIRKITETSNERKKHEKRIKILLKELNETRNSLAKSHERFSILVRELIDKKEMIDKSWEDKKTANTLNGNKVKTKTISNRKNVQSAPITSTPIKSPCQMDETTMSAIVTSSTNNGYEDMDVCNSDETDMCQIDIVDPNDIDQIFRRRTVVKSNLPEYVSPLNLNAYSRYRHVDPLGIMCPYEVNGSCRDVDCTFKHYLKDHERL